MYVCAVCTVSWAAMFSGWAIGGWGGVVAMSSFLEKFFPAINGGDSLYDSKNTLSADGDVLDYETDGNTNLYCIFNDNVLTLTGSILYAAACPAVLLASIVTHRYGRKSTLWYVFGIEANELYSSWSFGVRQASLHERFISLLGCSMTVVNTSVPMY